MNRIKLLVGVLSSQLSSSLAHTGSLRAHAVVEAFDLKPDSFAFSGEELLPKAVESPITQRTRHIQQALDRFEHYVAGEELGHGSDPGDLGSQIRQEAAAAWEPVLRAQALTHERRRELERAQGPVLSERWAELAHAVPLEELLFCLCGLVVVLVMDVLVLQELPETDRTHLTLIVFWMLVAAAFGTEAWFRLGPLAGAQWLTGYAMEVSYSLPHIFLMHFVFTSFATPTRLMGKALFVATISSMLLRIPLFLGLADLLGSLPAVLYGFGVWLMFCGVREAFNQQPGDLTQMAAVSFLRSWLGDRLGEFYDEDGEAVVLFPQAPYKEKTRVTLLAPVIFSLIFLELLGGLEASVAKAQTIPNAYLNISSSAMALLTIRALFFVVRSLFGRFAVFRHATAGVLIIMGARLVLAQLVTVTAESAGLMVAIYIIAALLLAASNGNQSKARAGLGACHAATAA